MLKELLREYDLPKFSEGNIREECLKLMQKYEFGHMPKPPKTLHWEVIDASDKHFAGGKTLPTTVRLYGELENGREYGFPVRVCIPAEVYGKTGARVPFFVHLNFRPNVPDKCQPTEEIIDNGFAVLSFCYTEVTSDDGDFTNGLAGAFFPDGKREGGEATGKLAMWAWAAMRVMDFAKAAYGEQLDFAHAAVTGHSRLGKTALLVGAYDERFQFVFSNCAGCGGDALERYKSPEVKDADVKSEAYRPETIADITKNFPYWFCPNYCSFAGKDPADMPFDQHFLTACIAPRHLYLVSAALDFWADPKNQFMNCVAVSEIYERMGKAGIICPDRLPLIGETFPEGNVGYSLRPGQHSQNRTDWLHYMDYMKRHM